jgi:GT2 family glycosyltransferase
MKYQFINNKSNTINLPDKNGKLVYFDKGQKKVLDEYFKKYVPKFLSVVKIMKDNNEININKNRNVRIKRGGVERRLVRNKTVNKNVRIQNQEPISRGARRIVRKTVVGRALHFNKENATKFSVSRLKENSVTISNDIGIGILSFNRLDSLKNLIGSIRKYTDLTKTTIFVSDESTDNTVWEWLEKQNDIIAIRNERGGIAVNSNRLLKCLSRFKHKLILNDDVEILKEGWDSFYFGMMDKFNLKHFCYYQNGVYGAKRTKYNGELVEVLEKPHGAVLAIHDDAFRKVGYFDEKFGKYGFEHVDYSDRINRACHENGVYYDVVGSEKYFKIYDCKSSDPDKFYNFKNAKEMYKKIKSDSNRIWIDTSEKSDIESVTYVIPFRNIGRDGAINTVINNIKAQRFPGIEIIVSEQDNISKFKDKFSCVKYVFEKSWQNNMQFCKAAAFNKGVYSASNEMIILHDADMIVDLNYTKKMYQRLLRNESVHIGKTVCYMDEDSTSDIIKTQSLKEGVVRSDRIVDYYEGGSLGINRSVYHRIGGFCEDFIGYGNEDTEFYNRMINGSDKFVTRSEDLFHLWHSRTGGWEDCHKKNKNMQQQMARKNINTLMDGLRIYLDRKYGDWN